MSDSKALVGPLPTIAFRGGPIPWWSQGERQAYQPPRNTLDLRYALCADHHPACDCREAEFSEERQEFIAEFGEAKKVFAEVLAGHQTYAWDEFGERDEFGECKCTGCEIARRTNFRQSYHVSSERHEANKAAREKREARRDRYPF